MLDSGEVVEDLRERGERVRRARGIGDDRRLGGVGIGVDTVGQGDVRTLRGGADEDLLRSGVDVCPGFVRLGEATGGLEDDVDVEVAPRQLCRVLLGEDADRVAVDDDAVAGGLDGSGEASEGGVVLEETRELLDVTEVVDRDDVDLAVALVERAQGGATDATESVDGDAGQCLSLGGLITGTSP